MIFNSALDATKNPAFRFSVLLQDIGTFVQYRAVRNMALPLAESVLHVGNNEKERSLDVVIDFDFFLKMENANPVIAMLAIPSTSFFRGILFRSLGYSKTHGIP